MRNFWWEEGKEGWKVNAVRRGRFFVNEMTNY